MNKDKDWFDKLSDEEGIDSKDLKKSYEKSYEKIKPIKIKNVIKNDIISNIDAEFMSDFHDIEFYPMKDPYRKYKEYNIIKIDNNYILIKERDKFICFFYIYHMDNIYITKDQLHMDGFDYNIIYDFNNKTFKKIHVR